MRQLDRDKPGTTLLIGVSAELMHVAQAMGLRGERIALMSRTETRLTEYEHWLNGRGVACAGFPVDVTEPSAVLQAFTALGAWSVQLQRMIYDADVVSAESVDEGSGPELHHAMNTDLFGFVNCIKLAQQMFRRGGGGHVVTIRSGEAGGVVEIDDCHSTGRSALHIYVTALRRELAGEQVELSEVVVRSGRSSAAPGASEGNEFVAGVLHALETRAPQVIVG
jgi:short-subunit dehydrogenase